MIDDDQDQDVRHRSRPQVAEWAGHSVDVLLRVYAKCIHGQQDQAKRRILEATQPDQPSEQSPAGCPDDNPGRE